MDASLRERWLHPDEEGSFQCVVGGQQTGTARLHWDDKTQPFYPHTENTAWRLKSDMCRRTNEWDRSANHSLCQPVNHLRGAHGETSKHVSRRDECKNKTNRMLTQIKDASLFESSNLLRHNWRNEEITLCQIPHRKYISQEVKVKRSICQESTPHLSACHLWPRSRYRP